MLVKTLFAKRSALRAHAHAAHDPQPDVPGQLPASTSAPIPTSTRTAHLFHQDLLKQGRINFLLQGILYADGVSTVSPTYAQRDPDARSSAAGSTACCARAASTVVGILNGVDYDEWSPETDRFIPHRYSASDLAGKERRQAAPARARSACRTRRASRCSASCRGSSGRRASTCSSQVMPELLAPPRLPARRARQRRAGARGACSRDLQRAFPRQVCFYNGFKNELAHLIEAGADMFLMPSRYEPCGLNQMYSLRYGTVPIVHTHRRPRRHRADLESRAPGTAPASRSSTTTRPACAGRPGRARDLSRPGAVAAADAERHGRRTSRGRRRASCTSCVYDRLDRIE